MQFLACVFISFTVLRGSLAIPLVVRHAVYDAHLFFTSLIMTTVTGSSSVDLPLHNSSLINSLGARTDESMGLKSRTVPVNAERTSGPVAGSGYSERSFLLQ